MSLWKSCSGLVWTEVPKTATIISLKSNPWSSLLTSVPVRFSVHTTQERVTKTYPICDDPLLKPKQRSIAPAQKSIWNRCCVNEKSPIQGVFVVGTRAFPYSVHIALSTIVSIHRAVKNMAAVHFITIPWELNTVCRHTESHILCEIWPLD